jgi:hypothetical protein
MNVRMLRITQRTEAHSRRTGFIVVKCRSTHSKTCSLIALQDSQIRKPVLDNVCPASNNKHYIRPGDFHSFSRCLWHLSGRMPLLSMWLFFGGGGGGGGAVWLVGLGSLPANIFVFDLNTVEIFGTQFWNSSGRISGLFKPSFGQLKRQLRKFKGVIS